MADFLQFIGGMVAVGFGFAAIVFIVFGSVATMWVWRNSAKIDLFFQRFDGKTYDIERIVNQCDTIMTLVMDHKMQQQEEKRHAKDKA
jgi:hypothetical protein